MPFIKLDMRKFLVFTLAIALSGCAATKPDSEYGGTQETPAPISVYVQGREVSDLQRLSPGTQITCSDYARGKEFKALVQHKYFSALGVECCKVEILRQHSEYRSASLCAMEQGWHIFYPVQNMVVGGSDK